jgi:SAM-dependent methyltransferase
MEERGMRCAVCGNEEGNRTHAAREMMFGYRDPFTYLECASCGCLQLMDPPADLSKYYPNTYYSFQHSPVAIFEGRGRKERIKMPFRYRYAVTDRGRLGKYWYPQYPDPTARTLVPANLTRRSRILDVGCGSGLLLYALRNAGFQHVMGVDPFVDETLLYANGLKILKQSIHATAGEWDLVMLHHAFEHVPDPLETLRSAARLLAPGGVCLIRIPVASSYAWRRYGTNWVQLDAPRHFFLHTPQSMRILADNAGLRLERALYDSYALQFWGSEQYLRDIPLQSERSYARDQAGSIFTPAEIAEFEARAEELNTTSEGDQAAFYLRK